MLGDEPINIGKELFTGEVLERVVDVTLLTGRSRGRD